MKNFTTKDSDLKIEFDLDFYLARYPHVASSGMNPQTHYETVGWRDDYWPHPYFDTPFYKLRSTKFSSDEVDPLTYYLTIGRAAGDIPHRLFNAPWYLHQNPDVAGAGWDPFTHFITFGDQEGRLPGPGVFFPSTQYNTLRKARQSSGPFGAASLDLEPCGLHQEEANSTKFNLASLRELVTSSGLFDSDFYKEDNPDVVAANWDPLEHYLAHGAFEYRDPNSDFDSVSYTTLHPESRLFSNAPFEHYLRTKYDFRKGRAPNSYMAWLSRFDWLERDAVLAGGYGAVSPTLVIVPGLPPAGNLAKVLSATDDLVQQFRKICIFEPRLVIDQSAIPISLLDKVEMFQKAADLHDLLAGETYVCFLFNGSLLHRNSVVALNILLSRSNPDFAYCDHDEVDLQGIRNAPRFKPTYSPEYLINTNYIGDVFFMNWSVAPSAVKSAVLGGVHNSCSDDAVRAVLQWPECRVEHLPFLMYSTLDRSPKIIHPRKYYLPGKLPLVSIIIPMRDKSHLTRTCIESILVRTDYDPKAFEIVIVDNDSIEPESKAFLDFAERFITVVRVVKYENAFNYAAINNFAARTCSKSDVLLFLNNDTKILSAEWLHAMVFYTIQPDVAAVGCKLLYEDGLVQHGGCLVGGAGGLIEHLHAGRPVSEIDENDDVTREISAVTGACMAIRREVFERLYGFDEVLRVAWNDINLCLKALEAGFRNIYISTTLLTHFESKSRGHDNDEAKRNTFLREAAYTRSLHPAIFKNDPYYSPNLSLESAGKLATPPRVSYHLFDRRLQSRKVLMLSVIHNRGYGVPVVMQQHTKRLIENGWEVYIGGPIRDLEVVYEKCRRVSLRFAKSAAIWALKNDIDLIVVHTPPFFQITQYLPSTVPVVFYDYGEPSPDFFPEPTKSYLIEVAYTKRLSGPLAARRAAISRAVKNEGYSKDAVVIGLGNSHLALWSEQREAEREAIRRDLGWQSKFVVLNVCRFATVERGYKGVDKYELIMNEFSIHFPSFAGRVIWVLAGAATDLDIDYARKCGFEVHPNITDDMLVKLYTGADAYMSFSRWEGYNLGIGQALAMGLPVIASSIEAHREFPITTSNSPVEVSSWLADQIGASPRPRVATVFEWSKGADDFTKLLDDVYDDAIAAREARAPMTRPAPAAKAVPKTRPARSPRKSRVVARGHT